ncbi:MAG: triose-phosphate isomerase [Candidatus Portnoybacteria bacterium RBG_13_41_18]|uniref:Triosephosphate isomerase n=1 Tax=Candidatus Portnoybacteria bacterium RBG_13_41_18 TaxID=1801991 RepID=A0A1G2F8Z2_9BACT|nr:MAG: triose-phosphate isomerase [Candidatus Portnoybacteria bacterium RBG_13_41_18]
MNIIVGNWKMNPLTARDAKALFEAVVNNVRGLKNIETIICPPFCYLSFFGDRRAVKVGGQDIFWELQGAYSGQISGKMLKDLGCQNVIIGHSERRQFGGDDDEIINLKLKAALKVGLTPIFCVGEQAGQEIGQVIEQQLKIGLKDIDKTQIKKIIIAYEPVWAIGTGNPCTPNSAMCAALLVKKILTALYSRFIAENIPVLYGGSVDSKNAAMYIKEAKMQGLLVGGASLDAEEFAKIGESVNGL